MRTHAVTLGIIKDKQRCACVGRQSSRPSSQWV